MWNALFVSHVRADAGEVIYGYSSQLDFTNIQSVEAGLAAARHLAKTTFDHRVDRQGADADVGRRDRQKTLRSVLDRVDALSTVERKLL